MRDPRSVPAGLLGVLLFSLLAASASLGGGVGISVPGESAPAAPQVIDLPFNVYRVPVGRGDKARRDLEFLWSQTYSDSFGKPIVPDTSTSENELDRVGYAVCEAHENPFGFAFTDIQLAYNYLNYRLPNRSDRVFYNPNPDEGPGFFVRAAYPDSDRMHLDVYVFRPQTFADSTKNFYDPVFGDTTADAGIDNYGHFPSTFTWALEDPSTGHDPELTDVLHGNAIAVPGPIPGLIEGTAPTPWSLPNGLGNWMIIHEGQHAVNQIAGQPVLSGAIGEILSSAAEALVGELPQKPEWDVPYTYSLLRYQVLPAKNNYQAWRTFTAYLAYDFRGADPSEAGFQDDLLARWVATSDSAALFVKLAAQLDSTVCSGCPGYFQGLSAHDRLQVLIHNWRVANYVNDTTLAEGQYGYPPHLGFSPAGDVGNWQDLDGDTLRNAVAIPPELTLGPCDRRSESGFSITRGSAGCVTCSQPMYLDPLGAEYWVIQSDPGLTGDSLVIRVRPEAPLCGSFDGRLMASLITYTQRGDTLNTLWRHPEWADQVSGPVWMDIGTTPPTGVLEFVIPDFGGSHQAAVVVISLGDGPQQVLSGRTYISETQVLPYAVTFRVGSQTCALDPVLLAAGPDTLARFPAWSPSGDEIAYMAGPAGSHSTIYRKRLDGGAGVPLVQPVPPFSQYMPDWSPRGDCVAFGQNKFAGTSHIWLHDLVADTSRQLTVADSSHRVWPAFSPNGQQLVYVRILPSGDQELHRIDLDGSNDVVLVTVRGSFGAPRWSPDGAGIYFVLGDSLLMVPAAGGAVVSRQDLLRRVRSFDLHLGQGPLAFVEPVTQPCTGLTYRLALQDTLRDGTTPQLNRPGFRPEQVRWSPDGTRVAFDSEPSGGGEEDVYYGAVTCNAPPRFSPEPRDSLVTSCAPAFVLDLDATDPDGQTVSFEGAYLPPGASLDPASGVLTWPAPGPPGAEYFVVLRARDCSGGVDSRVVRYTVAPDSGPPARVVDLAAGMGRANAMVTWTAPGDDSTQGTACEFDLRYAPWSINEGNFLNADRASTPPPGPAGSLQCAEVSPLTSCTWYYFALKTRDDAGQWSALSNLATGKTKCSGFLIVSCEEGGLFAQGSGEAGWTAENALLEGAAESLAWDRYRLRTALTPDAGRYRVRLIQSGDGGMTLDSVSLAVVDHAATERAWPLRDGVLLGRLAPVERVGTTAGEELTRRLDGTSERPYATAAGETLLIRLAGDDEAADALLLECASGGKSPSPDSSGIVVEVPGAGGAWRTLALHQPRPRFDPWVVDSLGSGTVRLIFRGEHLLRRVGRVARTGSASPEPLRLLAARHSRLGDARGALAARDTTVSLSPDEWLELEFAAPALAGETRDWILAARGTATARPVPAASRAAPAAVPLPTAFALLQNQPNPFGGTTRIRFEMPRAERVRLAVFDLAGRRLATLVNGETAPGYHAVEWDGRTSGGGHAPAGVYLYRLEAGPFRSQHKMVLVQ